MSFSKAKLKRFNDVDVGCASPAAATLKSAESASLTGGTPTAAPNTTTASTATTTSAHSERKEQIEKFFKDAVRFATNAKEAKEFAIPKESAPKEDKKSKGLRLFRTPSLPHRLRFRHNSDALNSGGGSATSSTPLHSAATTPIKEASASKSASRLKGKEALQQEIRGKNDLIAGYLSQVDVLQRHVDQLKEAEQKLRDESANASLKSDQLLQALAAENAAHKELNDQLSGEKAELAAHCVQLEIELQALKEQHSAEVNALNGQSDELRANASRLEQQLQTQSEEDASLRQQIAQLESSLAAVRAELAASEEKAQQTAERQERLRETNAALIADVEQLKRQISLDALAYAQETKSTQVEAECLKNERNTLKSDLASKCELIRALQEELMDKTCEIDAHCDTIRQLCREKAKYAELERHAAVEAEQKTQKLESDLENALEREKAYWRGELDKRQKLAENEIIKVELEKQDVMVLLETTNDMLRERDDKLQRYEEQLRNGVDYYVQLTDNLQKQVVDLKQEVAKIITEKYNYQLTLSNTRSTVNILMERLKKSDADVEQFKADLESVQLAKGALEQSYIALQTELEALRAKLSAADEALAALRDSSHTLQEEVALKEQIFQEIHGSEEETLDKLYKIASSFQERIDSDASARYLDLYSELKSKDDKRETYMQDMKKALDEFATVLQFAQLELDCKDKALATAHDECDQLKLENISLKSRIEECASAAGKKENSTDLEKIEDLLIDSELRAECDKITSWLLNSSTSSEKCVRSDSTNEIGELLKSAAPTTPSNGGSKSRGGHTPVRSSMMGHTATGAVVVAAATTTTTTVTTPRTPRTPRTPKTPRTTPKKTVLFVGKENIAPSPQKQVLKTRNM